MKMRWVVVACALAGGWAAAQEIEESEPIGDPIQDPDYTGTEEPRADPFEPGEPDMIGTEDQQMDPFAPEIIATEDEEARPQRFDRGADLKGVSVMAGGGIEGYTGDFAPQINPGVGWSVVADLKPWRALGFELGYSGAVNELDSEFVGSPDGATNGADLVRNGGHAALIVGVPTPLQPYAMAGIGIDRYTFRGDDGLNGYTDDTSGSVPLGVGLRSHVGDFTADLRLGYDMLFDDQFSGVENTTASDGRYTGLLQVGGTF